MYGRRRSTDTVPNPAVSLEIKISRFWSRSLKNCESFSSKLELSLFWREEGVSSWKIGRSDTLPCFWYFLVVPSWRLATRRGDCSMLRSWNGLIGRWIMESGWGEDCGKSMARTKNTSLWSLVDLARGLTGAPTVQKGFCNAGVKQASGV